MPPPCPPPFTERGRASFYAAKFDGRKTASGEPHDIDGMTAAHRTLPLGAKLEVENLRNGRKVTVTVNDRGPFVRGRIVDVSPAAARRLGFTKRGTVPVRITAINACTELERQAAGAQTSATP